VVDDTWVTKHKAPINGSQNSTSTIIIVTSNPLIIREQLQQDW
jgi:hypothetical protein